MRLSAPGTDAEVDAMPAAVMAVGAGLRAGAGQILVTLPPAIITCSRGRIQRRVRGDLP